LRVDYSTIILNGQLGVTLKQITDEIKFHQENTLLRVPLSNLVVTSIANAE